MSYEPSLGSSIRRLADGFLPPVRMPLSKWTDEHARLSSEASVQPGHWRCFPYKVEPLDCLSPHSPYETVVLMWASQMSKTALILNLVGFLVAEDPGPCLTTVRLSASRASASGVEGITSKSQPPRKRTSTAAWRRSGVWRTPAVN